MKCGADLMDLFGESRNSFMNIAKMINDDIKRQYSINECRLMLILQKFGKMKLKDIAEIVGSKPVTCMRLGMLERKKFVAREVDMMDRRNVYYYVAPKGEKYLVKVTSTIKESLNKVFKKLDVKDMDELASILKKMNKILVKVA